MNLALWRFLLLLCLTSSCAGAGSVVLAPLPLDTTQPRQSLRGHLSFFKDHTGQLGFDAIRGVASAGRFQPVSSADVPTGYLADKPLWLHFAVAYPTASDPSVWWLLLAPELLNHITVYAEQTDGHFIVHRGGRALPFAEREMEGVGHAFRLGQDPGGVRHYFIKTSFNAAIKIEPVLWKEKDLHGFYRRVYAQFGAYVGVASLLGLLALSRALSYRNRWDVAYLAYIMGFEMFHITSAGLVQAWGLTDNGAVLKVLIQSGITLVGLSFVALTRYLIVWPQPSTPWPRRLMLGGIAGLMFMLALIKGFNPDAYAEVNFDVTILLLGISTLAGIRASVKGYTNASSLTLCFLPFVAWAMFVAISRWLEAPHIDVWLRNQILMLTSLLHLFLLWLLILGKESRLKVAKQQLEARLNSLREEMANTALFLDMLTHELNRPLNALGVLCLPDSAPDTVADQRSLRNRLISIRTEFIGIIEICTDRIQQAATSHLSPFEINLRPLVRGIVNHFQQTSPEHLIRHELESLPDSFGCDPKLVGILLSNLLENAVRYTPGGGVIWVTGKTIGSEMIEITVMDEGPGIAKSDQPRIFERYTQLNDSPERKVGMGLGLFIVRRIAQMHGGTVVCESEPGEGTTFRVTLKHCKNAKQK
jgi:signal transduction histidine kinase